MDRLYLRVVGTGSLCVQDVGSACPVHLVGQPHELHPRFARATKALGHLRVVTTRAYTRSMDREASIAATVLSILQAP
eukprot:scaffold31_cov334-Pavlova_lutheri.AAC.30